MVVYVNFRELFLKKHTKSSHRATDEVNISEYD